LNKKDFEDTFQKLISDAKKRNFDESVDVIFTFQNMNLKNKDNRFEFFVTIPNPFITKLKTLIFVKDKQLLESVKGIVNKIIPEDKIKSLSKKEIKQLAQEYDLLLAEGQAMLSVGKYLGQTLSPRGKMPQIVPANPQAIKAFIDSSYAKVKVSNKKNKSSVAVQTRIGKRSLSPSQIADNTMVVYNALVDKLPAGVHNIRHILFKTTMSKPIKVEGDAK